MLSQPKKALPEKAVGNVQPNKVATNQQAVPAPYFAGRRWLAAHWICSRPYNPRSNPIKEKVGKSKKTVGYDYFCDVAGLLGCCRLDYIEQIEVGGEVVWAGYLERDGTNPDYVDITIAGIGEFRIYWGTSTQPADDLVLATCGESHPRYLDQPYFVVKDLYCGDSPTVPTIRILAERAAYFGGLDELRSREGASGITALAEVIGDDFFGLGLPSAVHVPTWAALCEAVKQPLVVSVPGDPAHEAQMGYISPFLERQQSAAQFIAHVLEYYDAWLRPNGAQLEAGRFPHDGITPAGLTELSYHDFIDHPEFESPGLVGVFTDADVVHLDRDIGMEETATPGTNAAARQRLGEYRPQTYQRPFLVTTYQGRQHANELAKFYARPEETCTAPIRREKVAGLKVGDRCILNDSPNAASLVVRITERTDPGAGGEVILSFVAERGLAPLSHVAPADASPTLPDPALVPAVNARVFQLPAAFLGTDEADPAPALVALAQRPGAHVAGFNLHFSPDDATYDEIATVNRWALRGTLTAAILAGDGTLTINATGHDLAILQAQSNAARDDDTLLLFVDFEILSIGAVAALGGGLYQCTVLRGRRGSAAAGHAINAPCYVIPRADLAIVQHATFPRSSLVRWFKLQTFTADEEQLLADALKVAFQFDARGVTAPANLAAVGKTEAIFVSWDFPTPRDPTIVMVELFVRGAAAPAPVDGDAPDYELLADGFNLGGLAAGSQKYIWARFRDTIGDRSAIVGYATAIALAAPTGPQGPQGPQGPAGANGADGAQGIPGPGVPFRGNYNAATIYYKTDIRRDAVYYGGQYWATANAAKNGTATWSTPGTDGDWLSYGATYSAIATGLLLAEDATIVRTLTLGTDGLTSGLMRSANYVAGASGWQIKNDGTVEFCSGIYRGALEIGSGDTRLVMPIAGALTYGNTAAGHVSLNSPGSNQARASVKHGATELGSLGVSNLGGADYVGDLLVYSKLGTNYFRVIGNVDSSKTPTLLWAGDTNLYRSTANRLKTDDDLELVGELLAGDDIVFAGAQKLRFDLAGGLVSYISEAYGINLFGDSTHPIHIRNAAIVFASSAGAAFTAGRIYDANGDQVLRERYAGTPADLAGVIAVLQHHGLCD